MADGNIIANDLDQFRTDIDRFEESVEKMEQLRVSLFNELTALNGMWEGTAHDMLMARFMDDNNFTEEFIAFLKSVGTNYNEAYYEYARCEAQVADVIASMNLGEA